MTGKIKLFINKKVYLLLVSNFEFIERASLAAKLKKRSLTLL